MPSLTLRIFAWFWLTMTIVAAVFISLGFLLENNSDRFARFEAAIENMAAGNGQLIALAYVHGGAVEAERVRSRLLSPLHVSSYLLDAAGQDLLLPASDEGVREIVRRAREDGLAHRQRGGGPPLAAARIDVGAAGPFVFAVRMDDFPPYDLWQRPFAWAGRVLAAVTVSGVICFGLARYLSRPVRELRAATQHLAQGELSTRVPLMGRGRDEIAALQRDFNLMAERIEGLVQSQQRLLRDISHELRSPLARLVVALELSKRDSSPSAASLARIEIEVRRMDDLIGQTLAAVRADADELGRLEIIDIGQLVQSVVADANFEGGLTGRRVEQQLAPDCLVRGSSGQLRSAIDNVIRNALRFTPQAAPVEASVSRATNGSGSPSVQILVRDHGPGVPAEALAHLFRPFYRVESARDRETGGVGLGLTIAERAVRLHGGRIGAENHPAGGLLITIDLPADGGR